MTSEFLYIGYLVKDRKRYITRDIEMNTSVDKGKRSERVVFNGYKST